MEVAQGNMTAEDPDLSWVDKVPKDVERALDPLHRAALLALRRYRALSRSEGKA